MFDLIGLGIDKLSARFNRLSSQEAIVKLGTAIKNNQPRRAKYLFRSNKIDPNALVFCSEGLGYSLILWSVVHGQRETAFFLKNTGADINISARPYCSTEAAWVLRTQASYGNVEHVRLLLDLGADLSLKELQPVYDHASVRGWLDIKNILDEAIQKKTAALQAATQPAAQQTVQTPSDTALVEDCTVFSKPVVPIKRKAVLKPEA